MKRCTARYHGTASAYTKHRCRCATARADKARRATYDRSTTLTLAPVWVSPVGIERRLRALVALLDPETGTAPPNW